MSEKIKQESWFKKNIVWILGFVIPFVILGTIFIKSEIYPFGDSIYLRSDMYHQYAPFYKELYEKIVNGGSMTFSWNIGMGVNFSAIYSYYLASPVNLFLGLVPEKSILLVMDILILIKTALAGMTCAYYLSRHFHTNSLSASAFAVFYALSSYMAAFSWNIMWLDCMVLLPLVILGLESLVKEGKFKLYTIALGVSIFSNYYIAIMMCMFAVLYFAIMLVVHFKEEKHFASDRCIRFVVTSLIAGGIGATMILPEIYALGYTVSSEFEFPDLWQNYFSILDMMKRSLIEIPVAIFEAHDPNVYCTVSMFLLLPMYCLCSQVNVREKVGKMILVAFFLFSFNTNVPNYIWHGFHFPNSLPARESFIYIFLVITMLYEAYLNIRNMTKKQIFGCFAGAVGVVLLLEELYEDELDFQNVYISLIFILFYFLLFLLDYNRILYKQISVYLLIVICAAEAFVNSNEESSYKPTTYSSYVDDNDAIETMVEKVSQSDDSFYRIEKLNRRTKNDAAWNGYKGVSIFSSMASAGFNEYLGALGFEQSTNAYSYYGFTPLTSALLDVKYVFSNTMQENETRYTLEDFDETEYLYLYRVNACLPVAFVIPSGVETDLSLDGNNPFAVQNQFVDLTTDETEIFHYIPAESSGKTVTINVEEDSDVYIYVVNYLDSISYTAYNAETPYSDSGSFSDLEHRRIVELGEMPAGTVITVTTSDESTTSLQLYAYNFDEEAFDRAYEQLGSQPLENITYGDDNLSGTVTATSDGLLYTSIIYDEGWSVYVDGVKTEYTSIADALIAVPLSAGEHTIEFQYYPQGKKAGRIITIVSILLFLFLIFMEQKWKKRRTATQEDTELEDAKIEETLAEELAGKLAGELTETLAQEVEEET